jgi:hypothetical protein
VRFTMKSTPITLFKIITNPQVPLTSSALPIPFSALSRIFA